MDIIKFHKRRKKKALMFYNPFGELCETEGRPINFWFHNKKNAVVPDSS